jgi:O-antigen/teichoic acid export membrane protein
VTSPPPFAAAPTATESRRGGAATGRHRALATGLARAGYLDLLAAQVMPLGVSFVLTLVSASLLGPERRGVLTFLMTAALLGGALTYGSLHVPVVEGLRSRDRRNLDHGLLLVGALWATLTVAGLVLVLSDRGGDDIRTTTEFGWALCGSGLVVVQLFLGRVLQGVARNREYGRLVAAQSILYLLAAGSLLVLTRSPWLMFAGWYGAVALSLVQGVRYLRKHLAAAGPWAAGPDSWRPFLRSAMANNIGSVGQMVMLRVDVLVVALLLGASAAGVYGVALSLTELALIVPEVFALSVFAGRARLDHTGWVNYVTRTLRLNAALAGVTTLGIVAVAVLLTLGPLSSYRGLVSLVVIILPGAVLAGYTRIALGALQAVNAHTAVWRFGLLALVLAVAYVPAAVIAGTTGVAVVSSLAYAGTALFLRVQLRQRVQEAR